MALFASHVITPDSALGGKVIERSLRFTKASNPQLNGTGTSTSSTYTISVWFKYCAVGNNTLDLLFSIGQANDGNSAFVGIDNNNKFVIYNNGGYQLTSTDYFRDEYSWHHFVISVNSNSYTAYIDGDQLDTGTMRSLDTTSNGLRVGIQYGNYYPWDGYLADFHLIDGQAKTPTDFAFTSQTGTWLPKKYTGTFGSGGVHLDFSDNSSTTALGYDKSGNAINFTPSGFSVTAGRSNDSFIDTPTNNFPTLNKLGLYKVYNQNSNTIDGNLQYNCVTDNQGNAQSTMLMPSSGKWYFEAEVISNANFTMGIIPDYWLWDQNPHSVAGTITYQAAIGNKTTSAGEESYGSAWDAGNIAAAAVDMDEKTVTFYKDNTSQGTLAIPSGYSSDTEFYFTITGGTGSATVQGYANFGAGGFEYTPPTGFRALCARNRATPIPSGIVKPQRHFETILYSGNGSTNKITGLEFKPDFVWSKVRNATGQHSVFDSVRGATKRLGNGGSGIGDQAETTVADSLQSFDENGFTFGNEAGNNNGENYVAWCWKGGGTAVSNTDGDITSSVSVNKAGGFSIMTWTGNGTGGATVGHGLGTTPDVVIIKNRSTAARDWINHHQSLSSGKTIFLNSTGNELTNGGGTATNFNNSTIRLDSGSSGLLGINHNGDNYVAYCWTEIPGYTKFGKYKGNGSSEGRFLHLGFKPAFVLIKRFDDGYSWYQIDNKRDTVNPVHENLYANSNMSTYDYTVGDFLSNGIKFRNTGSDTNASGATMIYLAWAEEPSGTKFGTDSNPRYKSV